MKILSTVCSIVLLGTTFSGVSMAMEGFEGEIRNHRTPKNGYQGPKNTKDVLSSALKEDVLEKDVISGSQKTISPINLSNKAAADNLLDQSKTWGHEVHSKAIEEQPEPRVYPFKFRFRLGEIHCNLSWDSGFIRDTQIFFYTDVRNS